MSRSKSYPSRPSKPPKGRFQAVRLCRSDVAKVERYMVGRETYAVVFGRVISAGLAEIDARRKGLKARHEA